MRTSMRVNSFQRTKDSMAAKGVTVTKIQEMDQKHEKHEKQEKDEKEKKEALFPDYRHILSCYFAQSDGKQIVSHQIESFNQFIEVDIPEIIHMANPITSRGSP